MFGKIKEPMSGHSIFPVETELYLFGGITEKGFANC